MNESMEIEIVLDYLSVLLHTRAIELHFIQSAILRT